MISFEPLWETMKIQGVKKNDLRNEKIVSSITLTRMSKNMNIGTEIIDRLCEYLNCEVKDVVKYVPAEEILRRGGRGAKEKATK